ncbi:hypothetical protein CC2G_001403 [Coprinopsis cinerea AmutBmut pab1-1]|nr:hypothetical protein CC2G_001403 [Coprinopsis cinerea AmutBmut pab1-1]
MSASTIARWNEIPLTRPDPEPSSSNNLKRPRQEDDSQPKDGDDDDDDISIVSRTPSPPPPDAMDVDKYDEYVRRPVREVVTVDTKIRPDNRGFAMLMKMGWSEGQPLGLSEGARVDPIPFQLKNDSTGIGKVTRDVEMIETTVSQRRELDSERQQKETEDQRRIREEAAARKAAVESEISQTLKPFYCSLCDKQFKNVSQYDEHTNSYAHHHKARLRDMQANARPVSQEEIDKRKEKERKREEKELRKMAKAAGIKMPKSSAAQPTASSSSLAPVTVPNLAPSSALGTPIQKGGWATVSGGTVAQGGFKKTGWAAVGSASSDPAPQRPSSSGWAPASVAPSTQGTSGFKTSGWTSVGPGPAAPSNPSSPPIVSTAPPNERAASSNEPSGSSTAQPVRTGWQQFNSSLKGRGRR